MNNQASAQQRVDQIKAFQNEVRELESEGILTLSDEQSDQVQRHHNALLSDLAATFDVDTSVRSKQLSLGMKIASMIGALAMAVSVFFLFYQFWGRISTPLQVGILITAPVSMFLLALNLSRREKNAYFSKIAALVAIAAFVLNLSMLGQMFNITPSPNALLLWAALSFLLAYACNARLLVFFGIAFLASFIAARVGTWSGMYWIHFGERPEHFFLPAIVIFSIPQVIKHQRFDNFEPIYRVMALIMLFLPILILANWGGASYLTGDHDVIEGAYQVAGFALAASAIWLGIRRHWNHVTTTGNVFFVLFLYTKFFDWWWEWLPKYVFFFLMGLIAILLLMVFKRLRDSGIMQTLADKQGEQA